MRLTKIYTRKGDDGTTSLDGKNRLPKNALRIEAVGSLDELNSAIGLVVSQKIPPVIYEVLTKVQHQLFNLGGELCPPHHVVITADDVLHLEKILDEWNATLPPLKEFVLPQGNFQTAACHLARAICRRAERVMVALQQEEKINLESLKFVNRLSDVLFVAARMLAKQDQAEEILWEHGK